MIVYPLVHTQVTMHTSLFVPT